MSTMVVRMDCRPEARDGVIRHLREDVLVWAQEQDGFLGGSWHVTSDGRWAIGFVEFATEQTAERAAMAPRGYHDPDVPFRIASVEVYERVAATPQASAS